MNIGKPTSKLPQHSRRVGSERNRGLIDRALKLKPGQGLPIHCEDMKERNSIAMGLRQRVRKGDIQSLDILQDGLVVWIINKEEE